MENQFKDIELFEGKSLSNLFQEIYSNHSKNKDRIRDLVSDLSPLIDGIGDATLLVPLIKEYLEIDVKNDEQLVKLAQIVQRMDSNRKASANTGFDYFSDLQNLLDENNQIQQDIDTVQTDQQTAIVTQPQ